MRGSRRPFRLAVAASVGLHAALVGGLAVAWRSVAPPTPAGPPVIDTRAAPGPHVEMHFADADVPLKPQPADAPRPPRVADPTGARPEVAKVPRTLPADMLARIRTPREPVAVPGGVAQVAAVVPRPAAVGPLGGGAPVHGRLAPGQSVVYVVDASGSMGRGGRLDHAKRAVIATLRRQPRGVRFQVIVYAAGARFVVPGGWLPTLPETVERVAAALEGVDAVGRSGHAAGLALAGSLNPEFVLVFTDADDAPPADALEALTARLARPPAVMLAAVGTGGVTPPRPWR